MPDRKADGSIDTVLLDVDGTLVDSTYLHALAWMRAFAAHDLIPQWWQVHRAIGMGGDRLVGELLGDDVEESLGDTLRDEWEDAYRDLLPDVRPLPGAADLVRGLLDAGYRVALASSGKSEFTDAALESMGLSRNDFAAVTTSDDADSSKPAPDILSVALDEAGGGKAVVTISKDNKVSFEAKEGDATFRVLTLKDGGKIKEKLTDTEDLSYSYEITESPLPIKNYSSKLWVEADDEDDRSVIYWESEFEPADGTSEEDAKKLIAGILGDGVKGIKRKALAAWDKKHPDDAPQADSGDDNDGN